MTGTSPRPFVTVIVPCRNEAQYIERCLDTILATNYPQDRLELLVVDGRSDDGTREIVLAYAARRPLVRLLDNPRRIVPTGLNIAIAASRGELIIRLDAHVEYSATYISQLVDALERTGADSVGGRIVTLPANQSPTARAIALALSHRFGVGNAYFRVGTREPRWVDTAGFGIYRRAVFERIGLFDEEMVRNQDGELNFRLLKSGGRILLLPDAVAYYYARSTLRQLARMLYQYGYFKALTAKKVGRIMTARQLAPSAFVLSLVGSALLSLWSPASATVGASIAAVYVAVALGSAAAVARREGLRGAGMLAVAFLLMHVTYGVGYLQSIAMNWLALGRPTRDVAAMPLSR